MQKKCNLCEKILSPEFFRLDRQKKDGLSTSCKSCLNEKYRKYYAENKQAVDLANRNAYAKNREKRIAKNLEWQKANKEKVKIKSERWRNNNPDRAKEISRLGSHKRRARLNNVEFEKYTELQIIQKYGTKCYICSIEIDFLAPRRSGDKGWELGFHVEHVIDISAGGSDILDNIRPAHGICNVRKPRKQKF